MHRTPTLFPAGSAQAALLPFAFLALPIGSAAQCAAVPPPEVDVTSPAYEEVIANDPWCCDNEWDAFCQDAYNALVGAGCAAVPPPGVDPDSPEYAQVIADDPYCCSTEWDATCQAAYNALLGGGPANDDCAGALSIGNGEFPFSNAGATGAATSSCGFNDVLDIWYAYVPPCTGMAEASTCGSLFDTVIAAFDACGGTEIACNDDYCDLQSRITFPVVEGNTYWIRISGYDGETGPGFLTMNCANDGECIATVPPGVDTSSPEYAEVIADDPWCCENEWDEFCQNAYNALTGDCAAVPPPGVDTSSPEYAQVIADDPFCCNTEWDDVCQASYDVLVGGGPVNDDCAGATVVGEGSTPFSSIGATGTTTSSCGFGDTADVWFVYTASCTGNVLIGTCGSFFDTVLSAHDGCDGSEIACNDDFCDLQSQITFPVTEGTSYWIRVAGYEGETGDGELAISCIAPLTNNDCAEATAVNVGTTPFNTLGATGAAISSCGFGDDADVWFTYTASCTGNVIINTCGSSFDTVLSAYDACDGNEIACNDDACGLQSQITFSAIEGTSYWIRVAGFDGTAGEGQLTITCAAPLPNDDCESATVIGNGEHPFNTLAATGSGTSSCGVNDVADIWFEYVAPCTGTALASTCGSLFDTVIAAFNACGGEEIACNDDFCELQSQITFPVVAGNSYWIRIAGYDGEVGEGTLLMNCAGEGECLVVPPPGVDTGSQAYQEVIDEDPYCCDTAWDLFCQEAYDNLTVVGYCNAGALSTAFEKISNVTFAGIDNNSTSTAGYEDFTALAADVIPGQTYPFSVTIAGGFEEDQVFVWIDLDLSDSFEGGELVYTSPVGVGPIFSGDIPIPAGTPTGTTRMRVRLVDTHDGSLYDNIANTTPCGSSTYGQVEDYTVNIDFGTGLGTNTAAPWSVFPNPNNGDFTLQYGGIDGRVELEVLDMLGRTVHARQEQLTQGQHLVMALQGELAPGAYLLRLTSSEGRHEERIVVR